MQVIRTSSLVTTIGIALIMGVGGGVIAAQMSPWGVPVGIGLALFVLAVGFRRPLRRWRIAQRRLPESSRDWLAAHVPLYDRLPDAQQRRFERDVQFVLDEYSFEGVGGVDVTDPLRLSVAAGAALLLHGRPDWDLPGSRSVLFYSGHFDDDYFVSDDEYGSDYADYDGMAHPQGPVILTAPSVEESWSDATDGNNVVLHELAHLFDFHSEDADGVPSLIAASSEMAWQDLVRREMDKVNYGQSILRPYAAEAPSEFFAVAVEHFFEEPDRLAEYHPDLFDALVAAFNLDPRDGSLPAASDHFK